MTFLRASLVTVGILISISARIEWQRRGKHVKMKDMRDQHVIFCHKYEKRLTKNDNNEKKKKKRRQKNGQTMKEEGAAIERSNVLWYQTL